MFGLTNSDIEVIIAIFEEFPQINEAIIFGSRAMDRNKKGSDVDLALKGNRLGSITSQVAGKLNEETPLPYIFDVIDYDSISNHELQDHINRVGKIIYSH